MQVIDCKGLSSAPICINNQITPGHKGVVTAAIAARLGLEAVVYMDSADADSHETNVFRMQLFGATLKILNLVKESSNDVRQLALRHWQDHADSCFLVMGLDAAPEPYPTMALDFAAVVGREVRFQVRSATKRSPDLLVARAGNTADALGFFEPYLQQAEPRLVCVNCVAEIAGPRKGDREGFNIFNPVIGALSSSQKQVASAILDGLEYPSVEREHRALKASGRVEFVDGTASQAKQAISQLSRLEGLIPAVQTAQVFAWAADAAAKLPKSHVVVVNMVEHADKDIWDIRRAFDGLGG